MKPTFEMVLKALGIELTRSKADVEFKGHCPFHDEKKEDRARFYINEKNDYFTCYICKKKGTLADFVRELGKDEAWLGELMWSEREVQLTEILTGFFDLIASKTQEERAGIAAKLAHRI